MASVKLFKEDVHNDWCPGCGDFGILNATQMALAGLDLEPHNVALFSGVGCSGKTPHYVRTYGIHTLHGRVLPFATGAKIANPHLEVVAVGGDGDGYGIGAGHFSNSGRRNLDMAYIVFNNGVYGLTKGQASPTLKLGVQTKSLPAPNINQGVNPLALAISAGYTFVARSYAFNVKHLKETIMAAIEHKGAALVDVLQPCPTYNNLHTKDWFGEQEVQTTGLPRVYQLEDEGYDGVVEDANDLDDLTNKMSAAIARTFEWGDRIPIGTFYKARLPTYGERISQRQPKYPDEAWPADGAWQENGRSKGDIGSMVDEVIVRR